MPEITVETLCKSINAEFFGDGEVTLTAIKPLESAEHGDLSFFAPTSKKSSADLFKLACNSKASAILVAQKYDDLPQTQILTPKPLQIIISLLNKFYPKVSPAFGIHKTAVIDSTATIETNVSIAAFCVVSENTLIGENTVIYPHVVIYPGANIGKNCIIHSGAVIREGVTLGNGCVIQNGAIIGSDGFGYTPDPEVGHKHIPHVGSLLLGEQVDIGSNTTIDRGMLGDTVIGKQTKIDNLVQIGHNNHIGSRSLLCGLVGVSGSCEIGSNVILAGGAGVADHINIGDNARAAARSGIIKDVQAGARVAGFPASPATWWQRMNILKARLPQIYREIKSLGKRLDELEKKI